MVIKCLTFGPFQENTYVVSSLNKNCIIFDPGNFDENENLILSNYIEQEQLKPQRLINTHGHIDHVAGNKFVSETYELQAEIHKNDLFLLQNVVEVGRMYGLQVEASPGPAQLISENDTVVLDEISLDIVFTPGHSPGSLCFIDKVSKQIIGGDVLFHESIGRTDLPGGNHAELIKSIETQLLTLEDEFIVHSGHGPSTSIGHERRNNPFLG